MKFPSIVQVQKDASAAAKRFPFSLFFGVVSAILACYLIQVDLIRENFTLVNMLLTTALGIPLFFSIDTFAEKNHFSYHKKLLAYLIGFIILVMIYLSFPSQDTFTDNRAPYIRYIVYNLSIHLSVAFLPFWGNKNQLDFWNYNKSLFLRLVTGAFYTAVIFIGIVLAIALIHELFQVNFDERIYGQLFAVLVFVFNTWFFLAEIPSLSNQENATVSYPKGLKIFTQFILIPLLLVYLIILYFYGLKILISGDWPQGVVSYMIIAISVLGVFTNLLLYPYQQWKDSGWVNIFYRTYYIMLLPLIVLLFLAIGIRIQEYGLTVNRYIITILGVWLTVISVYYALDKKNIKFIPISLAIFMIFASFGPWGMFSLSEKNQKNRLSELLSTHGILVNGKIQNEVTWEITKNGELQPLEKQANKLPRKELKEVNSILYYLEDYHGFKSLYPWFEQDLPEVIKDRGLSTSAYSNASNILVITMGLEAMSRYEAEINSDELFASTFVMESRDPFEIKLDGYDFLISLRLNKWEVMKQPAVADYSVEINSENKTQLIVAGNGNTIAIELLEFINQKKRLYSEAYIDIPSKEMHIEEESSTLRISLQIRNLDIFIEGEELSIERIEGLLLIQEK